MIHIFCNWETDWKLLCYFFCNWGTDRKLLCYFFCNWGTDRKLLCYIFCNWGTDWKLFCYFFCNFRTDWKLLCNFFCRVQRGLVGSALACCKAGPSSNLGWAPHGGSARCADSYEDMEMGLSECLWMKDVWLYQCIYCIVKRKINPKRVAYGHQTFLTSSVTGGQTGSCFVTSSVTGGQTGSFFVTSSVIGGQFWVFLVILSVTGRPLIKGTVSWDELCLC